MDGQSLDSLTAAVAPVVMVSAAGLLFNGVQAKNLHLSDRIRAPRRRCGTRSSRPPAGHRCWANWPCSTPASDSANGRSTSSTSLSLCFILTSLLLASTLWIGPPALPALITAVFLLGVAVLVVALGLEFCGDGHCLEDHRHRNPGRPARRRAAGRGRRPWTGRDPLTSTGAADSPALRPRSREGRTRGGGSSRRRGVVVAIGASRTSGTS